MGKILWDHACVCMFKLLLTDLSIWLIWKVKPADDSQVSNLGAVGAPPMSPQTTAEVTCYQFLNLASWGCFLVEVLSLAKICVCMGEWVPQEGHSNWRIKGGTTPRTHDVVFLLPMVITSCITPSLPGLIPHLLFVGGGGGLGGWGGREDSSTPTSTTQTSVSGAAAKGWYWGHAHVF